MSKAPQTRDELRVEIQKRVDEIISLAENFGEDYVNVEVNSPSIMIIDSEDWTASWESSDASC